MNPRADGIERVGVELFRFDEDLLAHPDSTPEQLALIRGKLMQGRANMREVYKQMRGAQDKFGTMWLSPVKPAFMEKK